jgi:hypothetical protein
MSANARQRVVAPKSQSTGGDIQMTKMLRVLTIGIGEAALMAVSAATASAGDRSSTGGGAVRGASAGAAGGGGGLPFTGADLAGYAVIATAIVVSGLALRAYSERRDDQR